MIFNNKYYNLLLLYNKTKCVPPGHIKLSLTTKKALEAKNKNPNNEIKEIQVPIPKAKTSVPMSIEKINNLDSINIISWIRTIKNMKNTAGWDDTTILNVMSALIDSSIVDCSLFENFGQAIETLKYLKYTEIETRNIKLKLQNLNMKDFYLVKHLKNYILELVNEIGEAKNWDQKKIKDEFESYFINALDMKLKIELNRLKINEINEVVTYLLEQEEMILQGFKAGEIRTLEEKPITGSHISSKQNQKNYAKKYCSFHKKHGHNDSECFYLNKQNSLNKNSSNKKKDDKKEEWNKGEKPKTEKSFMVKEASVKITPIILDGKIQNENMKILIDSGEKNSFISEDKCQQLGLQPKERSEILVKTADGKEIKINKEVETELLINNTKYVIFKFKIRIFLNADKHMILGTNFMVKNNVIKNFKQKFLTIDRFEIEMLFAANSASSNDPD